MNDQSKKSFRPLLATIIVAAVLVSAGLLVATFNALGSAKTVTVTEPGSTTVASSSVTLHEVTFNETGSDCTAGHVYDSEWYVTLANVTIVQPSNATLPFPNSGVGYYAGKFGMISKIIFTVPDGTYPYHASLGALNGTVTVNGSNVVVQVPGPFCS
jgi:hypothetical protein